MRLRGGALALVSGGVESLALTHTLLARYPAVVPLYVRCGLRWERAELQGLRRWLAPMRTQSMHRGTSRLAPLAVIDAPLRTVYGAHWSLTGRDVPSHRSRDAAVYLPGRNLLLLSYAAMYAVRRGLFIIALGTLGGNPFGDATPHFFRQLSACLRRALSYPIQIVTPLRRFTKAHVLRALPNRPFHLTFSCIHPMGLRHCGRCNKCAERRRAFRNAGMIDHTSYAAHHTV